MVCGSLIMTNKFVIPTEVKEGKDINTYRSEGKLVIRGSRIPERTTVTSKRDAKMLIKELETWMEGVKDE